MTLFLSLASAGSGAACALWFSRSCALQPGCVVGGPEPLSGRWWTLALLALGTALFLQLAANLVDDAADGVAGRDSTRSHNAPPRLVAQGANARLVFLLGALSTLLAAVLGITACALAGGGRWWLLPLGLLCALAAWAYSAGPHPLSSTGWAPLVVVLAFGFAGVLGTQFLLCSEVSLGAVLSATGVGASCTAVLLVNDIRDAADDAAHGKRTLAVRLGGGAVTLFTVLACVGPVILLCQGLSMRSWGAAALALLTLVPAVWNPVRHAQRRAAGLSWTLALRLMCLVPPLLAVGFWLIALQA